MSKGASSVKNKSSSFGMSNCDNAVVGVFTSIASFIKTCFKLISFFALARSICNQRFLTILGFLFAKKLAIRVQCRPSSL